jgi:hypothetical protein
MTVKVPPSRFLSSVAAAQHGNVNLAIVAESARRTYSRMAAVHLRSRGTATLAVAGISRVSYRHTLGGRLNSTPEHVGKRECVSALLSTTEGVTRIGELHVANVAGEGGSFTSSTTTDNTISVGVSATGDLGSFSAGGSVTLDNSISADGGFSVTTGYSQYVDGHVYYGEYLQGGTACPPQYLIQATSSVGDAFPGTNKAPSNPYGTCHADPNGIATVPPLGHYEASTSQSQTYSGAFSWFGYSFSSSDGFTSDVDEAWINRDSTLSTYVCGNVDPVQDSHIFWNDSN